MSLLNRRALSLSILCLAIASSPTRGIAQVVPTPLRIHTFASPDPDSVNTYFVETDAGLVAISAQRVFSEATRAVAFANRLGKSVVAIIIPVAHTDHFGGLSVLAEAFPQAQIMASTATIESMRTDAQGYVASRKKALGDDFPSLDIVNRYLPKTVVKDGDTLTFGGTTLRLIDLPWNNAPSNTLVHFPQHGVLFTSELVEISITPFMRDADLDAWIAQAQSLPGLAPAVHTIYPAHGAHGPFDTALKQKLEMLNLYRDQLTKALRGETGLTPEKQQKLAQEIDAVYPDYAQVARLPRVELIGLNLQWQAAKRRPK